LDAGGNSQPVHAKGLKNNGGEEVRRLGAKNSVIEGRWVVAKSQTGLKREDELPKCEKEIDRWYSTLDRHKDVTQGGGGEGVCFR